jgi:YegS/Rv2252/BmrU family lipid kinase
MAIEAQPSTATAVEPVFIVNPHAGRGRGQRVAEELAHRLERRKFAAKVVRTSAPREATGIARTAASSGALVVAVGGDGTAHEVVNGLAGTEAVFGLVPVGSGNDLASALGIPNRLEPALDVLVSGRDARIDLGRFDDHWFANSLGLGFEAQVTIESRSVTRLKGFPAYLWAVLKALRGLRCPELAIRADEVEYQGRRLLVSIGNGPRVGGGFLLTPDAQPDDGILDVCLVEALSRWQVLRTLPRAMSGTHLDHPAVCLTHARLLEITSREGFPFHADGEVIDTNCRELRVAIVPSALRVRVPA